MAALALAAACSSTHTLEGDEFGQVFLVQHQQVEPSPQQLAPHLQEQHFAANVTISVRVRAHMGGVI